MARMASQSRVVIGGVDTHKDLHVAAMIDTDGVVIGTGSFSTTRAGYRALLKWLRSYGDVRLVGVEGTGSYGKGLTKHLLEAGVEVVEVCRPDRSATGRDASLLHGQVLALHPPCGVGRLLVVRRDDDPRHRPAVVGE